MRLLTWNVNGLRAVMKKGLEQILDYLDADIVCLQEIKCLPEQVELDEDLYPYQYVNSAVKKGYSGTLIASRTKPQWVKNGMGIEEHDQEGRVITARFEDFTLVNVYTPNSKDGLKRLDYRQSWDAAFADYVNSLPQPVLLCGDFNVARGAMDIWSEEDGKNSAGYSDEEKAGMEHLLETVDDVWRVRNPDRQQYTWWSYYSRGRDRNQGWRIDYWLASPALMDKVESIDILDDVFGSDHCPVLLELDAQ